MKYEKNQILETEIIDMTSEGEGVGKINGYPIFIKDAIIGDNVQFRITRAKKTYAYGKLEKILIPSPFRVKPKCRFHKQCGGCQIQAMSYERQLQYKESKIKNNLIRIGSFSPDIIDKITKPVLGMKNPFHYRNKAQYPIGEDKAGNPVAGFYAGRTHSIIANTTCFLGSEKNEEILKAILSYMKDNHISAYNETTCKGIVRHVLIREGYYSKQIMVCLVVNLNSEKKTPSLPAQGKLVETLSRIPNMTSVSLSINTENTNVIMGKEIYTIWGKDTIEDTVYIRNAAKDFETAGKGITFSLSPLSFYQVNPVQMEKLYSIVLAYAELTGNEVVWDIYCGIGTISLFLAQNAKQVYGIESVPQAIENACENARSNNIDNARFFTGLAEDILPAKYEKEGISADVIVVDPPRKGCDKACLETMLKIMPPKIIYVSCDSATLARDLKILCEGGYKLEKVQGVDLFPMTVHTETVVLLSKPD